jgi:hypothetical protein
LILLNIYRHVYHTLEDRPVLQKGQTKAWFQFHPANPQQLEPKEIARSRSGEKKSFCDHHSQAQRSVSCCSYASLAA